MLVATLSKLAADELLLQGEHFRNSTGPDIGIDIGGARKNQCQVALI